MYVLFVLCCAQLIFVVVGTEVSCGTTYTFNATSGNNNWNVKTNWNAVGGSHPSTYPGSSDAAILLSVCPPTIVDTNGYKDIGTLMLGDSNSPNGACSNGATLFITGSITVWTAIQATFHTTINFTVNSGTVLNIWDDATINSDIIAYYYPLRALGTNPIGITLPGDDSLTLNGVLDFTETIFQFSTNGEVIFGPTSTMNLRGNSIITFFNNHAMHVYFQGALNIFSTSSLAFVANANEEGNAAALWFDGTTNVELSSPTDSTTIGTYGSGAGALDCLNVTGTVVVKQGILEINTADFGTASDWSIWEGGAVHFQGAGPQSTGLYSAVPPSTFTGGTVNIGVISAFDTRATGMATSLLLLCVVMLCSTLLLIHYHSCKLSGASQY